MRSATADGNSCGAPADRRWELYDIESDRTESTDLSAKMPERVGHLARAWEHWAKMTEVAGF
ncbi:MAG: hypothetical protein KBA71_01675 [Opitutaceae bacterium]|nr:hypothetical protein [Opitutaceae bacterium]